jgi:transposase
MICKLPCCLTPEKATLPRKQKRKSLRKLPYLSNEERHTIVVLKKMGKTHTEIGTALGCHRTSSVRIVNAFRKSASFQPKKKTGRPKKISLEIEQEIVRLSEENRLLTSGHINSLLREKDPNFAVHDSLIRRVLIKNGLDGCVCSRKPLLRAPNKVKRFAFGRKHANKPIAFWRRILWSDEKKFELFNTKRRRYCRLKKESLCVMTPYSQL